MGRASGDQQDRTAGYEGLWDWRRRIADLYGVVRESEPSLEGWRLWRAVRDELFAHHGESPLAGRPAEAFEGLSYYAYDAAFRYLVELEAVADAPLSLAAGGDGSVELTPFARTRGLAGGLGGELTLYWIGGYGGGVFLPFRDGTSGRETFGGGRYLLDTIKGADLGAAADGRTVLDFNFAYNPSCAYSERWICPLAPPENRLPRPVWAGERTLI